MSKTTTNLILKILKFLYQNFIIILPLFVGVNLLFQSLNSNDLTVYLYDSQKEEAAFVSKFEIYNEGSAVSKNELIQPLIINLAADNTILSFDLIQKNPSAIKVWFSKRNTNKLSVDFNLLNNAESITFLIVSKRPIHEFTVSSRIKNVKEVITYHYKEKPKIYDRINTFWIFLCFFSIISFIDAYKLRVKNKQLKALFLLIESLTIDTDEKRFLETYKEAYTRYNIRFKKNVITVTAEMSVLFSKIDFYHIEQIQQEMKHKTKWAVFYTLRKPYLILSPILFLISIIAIIISVMYYAIL